MKTLTTGIKPEDVRLSVRQAAEMLGGFSDEFVYDLIRTGQLESRKLGSRVVIPLTSYRAYLQRTEVPR